MKRTKLASGLLLLLTLLMIHPVYACTIFTAKQDETVLFAGNEDQKPKDAYLIVDTSGTYGVVYIGTSYSPLPLAEMTGINEQGLCYGCNAIPTYSIDPNLERTLSLARTAITQLIRECATVEEVLDSAFTFDWGESMGYQIHFADITGDAAVIHPGLDGELTYTRKLDGDGHLVSTNFNLADLASDDYSCWRYDTASQMLGELASSESLTAEFMASILDATHQEGEYSTIYSTVYDLKERTAYLYYNHRFDEPVVLDVATELERGDRQVHIDELLPEGRRVPNETIVSRLLSQPLTAILALGALLAAGYYIYRIRVPS